MDNNKLALTWAQDTLMALKIPFDGPPEIVRAMPWSCVSRFSTAQGFIYFKQMAPQFAVEPYVLSYLATTFNAPVPKVIAANRELLCFLMPDVGTRLREKLKENYHSALVYAVLTEYAQIQQKAISHCEHLLSLGVKDWRLAQLPQVYKLLLSQKDILSNDGLTDDEFVILNQLSTLFNQLCEELAAFHIPETIEHGDFQDNNILTSIDGKIIINDWGDANITHPFFSLGSWLDSASRHHDLHQASPRRELLMQAYLEQWQDYAPMKKLKEAFLVSERIRPALFTINFCRVATCPGMEKLGQFKGYIAQALREFIALNKF